MEEPDEQGMWVRLSALEWQQLLTHSLMNVGGESSDGLSSTQNYRQLRNAGNGAIVYPRKEHKSVTQYQMVSPKNMHMRTYI